MVTPFKMMAMMMVILVTPFSTAAELTPVNTKEIFEVGKPNKKEPISSSYLLFTTSSSSFLPQALIAHPPTRFPLLFAVLPTTNQLVVIISGPDADPNHFRKIEGAVIFRQPLASMTTGEPILQEGAGRLLAELYPDLPGYYKESGLGAVCFKDDQDQDHLVQCLLFMQHDHVENESGGSVVTFDLLVPFDGTAPLAATKGCVRKGEFWPRTASRIIPLPVDRLNQYFSYRARVQDHLHPDEEAFYLNSSLAKTTLVATLPKKEACSVDSSAAPLDVVQGPTVNKSLCNYFGWDQFELKAEGCKAQALERKFTAGFVVASNEDNLLKGVFLLPTFDSQDVMVLPPEVIADLDQALKVGLCDPVWKSRADFWNKWNSIKPGSCATEAMPTTAAPTTTTAKSTTTTSSTSTTTKKTTGKVVPDGKGSTTTATSSSPGNATSTPNNVTASVNGSTSHSEVDSTTGKAMLYIIIGVFVLVVILVLILITVICIWSKRGKSGQEKGGKGGAKEDKSVSRATSSAAGSSKVPSKVAASKVPSKVGGKAPPSKMKAKESATKQSKQQPLKAVPSKAAGGGKAPKAGPKGAKGKGTSNALGSSFQTSAVA